jgi:hypothetical protein
VTLLPRVTEGAREQVAREFDSRGPDVCMAEIVQHLERDNPELLDMAIKCAADLGSPANLLVGFGMFYRVLAGQLSAPVGTPTLHALPRVSPETRALLVAEIDEKSPQAFTLDAIADLEVGNPELLQLAHSFASMLDGYLHAMQGFALLYKALLAQAMEDRARPH